MKNAIILILFGILSVLWVCVGLVGFFIPIILAVIYSEFLILLLYLAYPFIGWILTSFWALVMGAIMLLLELLD